MFDNIDLKKELIKVRSNSGNDFVNSVNQLLDNDVIKEIEIEKNISKSGSSNYFAEIITNSKEDIFNIEAIKNSNSTSSKIFLLSTSKTKYQKRLFLKLRKLKKQITFL